MKIVALLTNYYSKYQTNSEYTVIFELISKIARQHWFYFVLVSANFQTENGGFSEYVSFIWWRYIVTNDKCMPDFLWNRISWGWTYLIYEGAYKTFPSDKILNISQNKYLMYRYFSEFMPKTYLLKDFIDNLEIRNTIGENVVLKPVNASWWAGVEFYTVDELMERAPLLWGLWYLLIVQEFIDLSEWIPGLTDGMHDMRLVFVDGKLSYTSLRIPAKWLKKSNMWAGGTEIIIANTDVPRELLEIATKIIDKFDLGLGNIFSLDFGYIKAKKSWYLIELNDFAGVGFLPEQYYILDKYINDVFKMLK